MGSCKITFLGDMIIIEIMNLRNGKPSKIYDVRVDRKSAYGNTVSYMANECERDKACDAYKAWFDDYIEGGGQKFERLVSLYQRFGKLRLFCWCSPKRCHAETIRGYILKKGGEYGM
jgi:hypothetical protein